jgi:hypothetical protein
MKRYLSVQTALVFALVLVSAAVLGAPAVAARAECKAINQTQDVAYSSKKDADPLGRAISEAAAGDTIKVMGTCSGNFVLDKELTLKGRPSPRQEDTLDGGGSGFVLRSVGFDVTVKNLTISGGDVGFSVENASASLVRTTIVGNDLGIGSGSVAETTIDDSFVSRNGNGVSGGLFGSLTIRSSLVIDNDGFGVDSGRAALTLSDSLVAGNGGGGILTGRAARIADSVIEYNTGADLGGGILIGDLSTIEMTDSIVRHNEARLGGGIHIDRGVSSTQSIASSVVTDNTATEAGGGIHSISAGPVQISDSVVTGNTAPNGGGLFLGGDFGLGPVTLSGSTVSGNNAASGGGIWNGRPLMLDDSAVTGNSATAAGGGIFGTGAVTLNGTSTACGNDPDDWPGC